jgi:chorismate--pyruvate lyase
LRRGAIAVSRISRHHAYVPTRFQQEPLWGRRSVFYLEDKPLLVSEVFLDAFVATLNRPERLAISLPIDG